jgi:hypothetical protein
MRKAKTKSRAERHVSYQKPALRSEAFARALSEAKLCVAGSGGLRSLFEQAARKAASLPRCIIGPISGEMFSKLNCE